MKYFISRNGQEYGPYTLADLQRYVASGNIVVTDLTRSEGMTDWVPVSQVIGTIPVPAVAPMRPAEPMLRREGKQLIVTRGADLPHFCVKCGQAADGPLSQKNFSWCNPLFALFVLFCGLLGIIVYLIIYYSTRKQMKITVPLCEHHYRSGLTKKWLGAGLLIGSPWLLIGGMIANHNGLIGYGLAVLLVMLIAGAILLGQAQPLRPKKIDDTEGIFRGAGEHFLGIIESQRQSTAQSA